MNSIGEQFPTAQHKGCLFHLSQIIYRQVQRKDFQQLYATDGNFANLVRQLTALAFLDPGEISANFDLLKSKFQEQANSVLEWFSDFYIYGKNGSQRYPTNMWSIADLAKAGLPRNQNSLEARHRRLGSIAGGNHIAPMKCFEFFKDEHHHNSLLI